MTADKSTLAEIVNGKPATAAVFEKYQLDYCCHGKRTLAESCGDDQGKLKAVTTELEKIFVQNSPDDTNHFDTMDLSELTDYIVTKHHHYVKEMMPMIFSHLEKVSSKHGERHPELHEIFNMFQDVKNEMTQHMFKEEYILFPRIKQINQMAGKSELHVSTNANFLRAPIQVMEAEHEHAGSVLEKIREITNNYTPPDDACTTYRLSYNELREFELDLHRHVHLENNNLFPGAIMLQEQLSRIAFN